MTLSCPTALLPWSKGLTRCSSGSISGLIKLQALPKQPPSAGRRAALLVSSQCSWQGEPQIHHHLGLLEHKCFPLDHVQNTLRNRDTRRSFYTQSERGILGVYKISWDNREKTSWTSNFHFIIGKKIIWIFSSCSNNACMAAWWNNLALTTEPTLCC